MFRGDFARQIGAYRTVTKSEPEILALRRVGDVHRLPVRADGDPGVRVEAVRGDGVQCWGGEHGALGRSPDDRTTSRLPVMVTVEVMAGADWPAAELSPSMSAPSWIVVRAAVRETVWLTGTVSRIARVFAAGTIRSNRGVAAPGRQKLRCGTHRPRRMSAELPVNVWVVP